MMKTTRRGIIAGLTLGSLVAPRAAGARDAERTRLILLGTAGGPRPRRKRSGSAQAIVAGGQVYIVDCGDGVARQMVLAGLNFRQLRHIFITHHHSDHNADFGTLVHLARSAGLSAPVDCWGPPPTKAMVGQYLEYQSFDFLARGGGDSKSEQPPIMVGHDLGAGGIVMEDGNLRVSATVVPHLPIGTALAYRFDAKDRSIVISGDTTESEALVRLARDADVLVHEVMLANRVEEMFQALPNGKQIAEMIIATHTTAEQVGRVAAAARVKKLVLSHLVPAEDPDIPDEEWLAPVRRHYSGPVVVGRDLLEI